MNTSKSFIIISPSINHNIKQIITTIFGMTCKSGVWKYLDVPIIDSKLQALDLNFIIDKILAKI